MPNVTVDEVLAALRGQFQEAFVSLIQMGFELPLRWVAIGVNGSMLMGEIEWEDAERPSLCCRVLGEYVKKGILTPPVNMMFVDRSGEVARVMLEGSGVRRIIQ